MYCVNGIIKLGRAYALIDWAGKERAGSVYWV